MERAFGVLKFRGLLLASSFAAISEFLMGFLGSVISGHWLGEEALAGVSLVTPIMTLMIFMSALLGGGMGINYSLRMGRCDRKGAAEIFTQGVWSVLMFGALLMLLMLLLRERFLDFMGPTSAVAAHARGYWNWLILVAILEPMTVLLLNVCYADGDPRLCYWAYGVQILANVAVSIALLALKWGTAACAAGSAAGYALASLVLCGHFFRSSNTFRLVRHFSFVDTGRICAAASGDASGRLGDAIVFFFLGKVLIAHYGSDMLPVMSAVLAVIGIGEVSGGVASAIQPIVTVYYGERNFKSIRQVMRSALKTVVVEAAVLTLLFAVFPSLAVSLVGIADPEVAALAAIAVRITAIGFGFAMFANVMNNYYQCIEREMLAVGLSVWKWMVMPLMVLAIFGSLGSRAVWFWYPVYNFLGIGLFLLYLRWVDGPQGFVLQLPTERDRRISIFSLLLDEKEIVSVSQLVAARLGLEGISQQSQMRAQLMTEEVLMAVKDRNAGRRVNAEVTLDLNDGVALTLRDDGEIFDITDSNARVSSLRGFLVASVMEHQPRRMNLTTTGFNRNVFRF